MKNIALCAGIALMAVACGNNEKASDATGTFEATETTIYAEQTGQLVCWSVEEGYDVEAATEVGLIDTTQLWLKIAQAVATKEVYRSQKPDVEAQVAATRQQLATAQQEQRRYEELVADGAAPAKQLDDARSQVKLLQRQLAAQTSALSTTTRSLDKQMAAADVQQALLREELRKCHIVAPVSGTVLEKYVERGEFVSTGKPLLKLADTKTMFIRAYVTSAQLQHVRLGQVATVYADYGDARRKAYDGRVVWISSQSEFTPKTIVTDDERADLVYAVKIAVKNDGYIKIGMYGEVKFAENQ